MSTTVVLPIQSPQGLNSEISRHFGHTRYFAVASVSDDGQVKLRSVAENPHLKNHRPGEVPRFIKSLGADVVLAGAMGARAIQFFEELGVKVSQAQASSVGSSIRAYLAGLHESVAPCTEHQQGC